MSILGICGDKRAIDQLIKDIKNGNINYKIIRDGNIKNNYKKHIFLVVKIKQITILRKLPKNIRQNSMILRKN